MRKKKLTAYLASGMEAADNMGTKWREDITPFLEKLGLDVLNPCLFEPYQLKGLQPNRLPEFFTDIHGNKVKPRFWHELKLATEQHLRKRFLKYMRRIIAYDMRVVEQESDCLVAYWNEATAKGGGTHAEITHAYLHNVPVYCVATTTMPAWTYAACTKVFLNFEDLREYLKEEFDYEEG